MKEPEYKPCPKCHESLAIDGSCPHCEDDAEKRRQFRERAIQMIGSERAWRTHTFERYQETPLNRKLKAFTQVFDPAKHNVFIFSPGSGTGKSHAAGIIKRRLILAGKIVQTLTMDDVVLQMRLMISRALEQRDYIGMLVRVPVLSLEDLGVEKDTEFAVNTLYQIVEGRSKAMRNGLIITSNLPPHWLASKHGNERVVSRLYELCGSNVFDLTGEVDWRQHNAD